MRRWLRRWRVCRRREPEDLIAYMARTVGAYPMPWPTQVPPSPEFVAWLDKHLAAKG